MECNTSVCNSTPILLMYLILSDMCLCVHFQWNLYGMRPRFSKGVAYAWFVICKFSDNFSFLCQPFFYRHSTVVTTPEVCDRPNQPACCHSVSPQLKPGQIHYLDRPRLKIAFYPSSRLLAIRNCRLQKSEVKLVCSCLKTEVFAVFDMIQMRSCVNLSTFSGLFGILIVQRERNRQVMCKKTQFDLRKLEDIPEHLTAMNCVPAGDRS